MTHWGISTLLCTSALTLPGCTSCSQLQCQRRSNANNESTLYFHSGKKNKVLSNIVCILFVCLIVSWIFMSYNIHTESKQSKGGLNLILNGMFQQKHSRQTSSSRSLVLTGSVPSPTRWKRVSSAESPLWGEYLVSVSPAWCSNFCRFSWVCSKWRWETPLDWQDYIWQWRQP